MRRILLLLACSLLCLTAAGPRAEQAAGIVIEKNVAATMRDGVVLRADIYRPAGPGQPRRPESRHRAKYLLPRAALAALHDQLRGGKNLPCHA